MPKFFIFDKLHKGLLEGTSLTCSNDLFLNKFININNKLIYNEIKDKSKIFVDKSVLLKGICDEYNLLKYGQAIAIISKSNTLGDENNFQLVGKYAVTRTPCIHPGDIRKIEFVKFDRDSFVVYIDKFI